MYILHGACRDLKNQCDHALYYDVFLIWCLRHDVTCLQYDGQGFYLLKITHTIMVLLESQTKLQTGDIAPSFELLGVDDKTHTLSEYGKDGLLVIFMCNHCPYVKAKSDALNELYDMFGEKIDIVGINSNDPVGYPEDSLENMKKTVEEKAFLFDYLVDGSQDVAKRYGAVCTPDPFLFDKDRRLVFHGRIDNAMKPGDVPTEKIIIINIQKMLSGQKIENDFDPSIGCSIKWKEN